MRFMRDPYFVEGRSYATISSIGAKGTNCQAPGRSK